jgi:hypothetical protein
MVPRVAVYMRVSPCMCLSVVGRRRDPVSVVSDFGAGEKKRKRKHAG